MTSLEPILLSHPIDPKVDCVFKALFGREDNKNLLIDFLNSILRPEALIEDVTLLNPDNDKDRPDEKGTSVDVKARDTTGALFQVEVQLVNHLALTERMLFNWATIYNRQLKKGKKYHQLRPLTSIWLLKRTLWKSDIFYHHHFAVWDHQRHLLLSEHFNLHTLEVDKWQAIGQSTSTPSPMGEDLWMRFFHDAHQWQALPKPLTEIPQMRQAMAVLQHFSEDELQYLEYLSRLDRERVQLTMEAAVEESAAALAKSTVELAKVSEELTKTSEELTKTSEELTKTSEELTKTSEELTKTKAQLEAQCDVMRQSLRLTYEARFGTPPLVLLAALDQAPLDQLTAWLPRFAISTDAELLALIA